jgi:hypothetical protein
VLGRILADVPDMCCCQQSHHGGALGGVVGYRSSRHKNTYFLSTPSTNCIRLCISMT